MKDQTKPGSFALFTVTQRQLDSGSQPESFTILCSKCREEIFRAEWDGSSEPDTRELDHPFQSAAALPPFFVAFNGDPEQRVCKACSHPNPPFPIQAWGWDKYRTQSDTMAGAMRNLLKAGGAASS